MKIVHFSFVMPCRSLAPLVALVLVVFLYRQLLVLVEIRFPSRLIVYHAFLSAHDLAAGLIGSEPLR